MEQPLPPVIDTHCHIDFDDFDADRDAVIAAAAAQGIQAMINVGSTVEASERAVALAQRYPSIYACVGCHPHDAQEFGDDGLARLEELSASPKVVAIGEIGLDYYRNLSAPEIQRRAFAAQIELARRRGLPLVIHSREAQDDTIAVMKEHNVTRAIIHCFAGPAAFLAACLEMGCYVSFTCNITYKKATMLREMVAMAPLERICVETDCPYLPPEGSRGRRNDPLAARTAMEQVAKIKGIDVETAAAATTANARRFFGI